MEKQFRKFKHKATRIPAVDAKNGLARYDIHKSWRCAFTTDREYACTLSHLVAIITAYKHGDLIALMMEDDMKILRLPTNALITAAPPDWQIIQLSASGGSLEKLYGNPTKYFVRWNRRYINTGAYLINRGGMIAVLAALAPRALSERDLKQVTFETAKLRWEPFPHFKGCNADYIIYDLVNTYTCCDISMYEDRGYHSTIQDDGALKTQQDVSSGYISDLYRARGFLMEW